MRFWIIVAALLIAAAIRPELEAPGGMSGAKVFIVYVALFGGLALDLLEIGTGISRKSP